MPSYKALAQMLPARANAVIIHVILSYDVAAVVENH